jgi:hypothetical protein
MGKFLGDHMIPVVIGPKPLSDDVVVAGTPQARAFAVKMPKQGHFPTKTGRLLRKNGQLS